MEPVLTDYLQKRSDQRIRQNRIGMEVSLMIILVMLHTYICGYSIPESLIPMTSLGAFLFIIMTYNNIAGYIRQKKTRREIDDLPNHPYLKALREEFKPKTEEEKAKEREEADKRAKAKTCPSHTMEIVPEEWIDKELHLMITAERKADPEFAKGKIIKISGRMVGKHYLVKHDDIIEMIDFPTPEEVKDLEKSKPRANVPEANCPHCGCTFDSEVWPHSYKAIRDGDKCVGCINKEHKPCPTCKGMKCED